MPELMPKKTGIREDVAGFISPEKIPSLFFEGTIQLKLFRTLKSDYPRFHNAYSLQVKTGHDRRVIIPILREWEKFKLIEAILSVKNSKQWRLSKDTVF